MYNQAVWSYHLFSYALITVLKLMVRPPLAAVVPVGTGDPIMHDLLLVSSAADPTCQELMWLQVQSGRLIDLDNERRR